jgi:hypothetical protein
MTLSDIREERIGQVSAIEIQLATAPKIQDDLRNYISKIIEPYDKVGLDDSIFDFAELVGYRINNSLLDIAEDLDVKSLYGLTTDKVAENSVGRAFRGHHDEDFFPDYQFEGLFSEEMNDMIEGQRKSKGGRKGVEARGHHLWSLEEIADMSELKYGEGLTWNDTTSEMNEKYGENWSTSKVTKAYQNNKHRLNDEEE